MHPDTEYEPALHAAAEQTSKAILRHAELSPYGEAAPSFSESLLAQMYLDLLERRGLPPSPKFNPSIQLADGSFFDFICPETTPVSPEVIAAAASKIVRCTGHILGDTVYSIGQHMCHASDMAPPPLKFKALMHDAHEILIGDMATPLKILCPDFKSVEKRIMNALADQYRLPHDFDREVKEIDIRMAATEKRDIMPPGEWIMLRGVEPYDLKIVPWEPRRTRAEWLTRFSDLYADHIDSLEGY